MSPYISQGISGGAMPLSEVDLSGDFDPDPDPSTRP